ncbi:hypothetical protein HO173_005971 [Letharia columbiana]|uniref:Uncharacterized protein n=1 Tax=Letharia columbiana TaxID=112416 RepID=A0A8H6L4Z0_9LECA|nr:uncharacterized protein HO173_005971 [Letharia columbiana]KAF6235776.1 hypothetical protein HO173_005971 [Letharia columbiana]
MVAGVEEVAKLISRYTHVEFICQKRQEVTLDNEFEERLLNLYGQFYGVEHKDPVRSGRRETHKHREEDNMLVSVARGRSIQGYGLL